MKIVVKQPFKASDQYIFRIILKEKGGRKSFRIGFQSQNFTIRHDRFWDSFYPLMYLTRRGGPLFDKHDKASAVFDFPVLGRVAEFFERRAANFGIDFSVEAERDDAYSCDAATDGSVVLFGGGKDSRLLLGTLRELGNDPKVASAFGARNASDIGGALCFEPFEGSMASRIVPGLMMLPRTIYQGSGLGEVHKKTPWHQYYDISSMDALVDTSNLLKSYGIHTDIVAPQSILPYNIVQRILCDRYPDIAQGQASVPRDAASDKNLHVSLLEAFCGRSYLRHCNQELFKKLLSDFITRQTNEGSSFGIRDHYEIISREMRAIIFKLAARGQLPVGPELVPSEWDADWINYIHKYVYEGVSDDLLVIYREYADLYPVSTSAESLPPSLRACIRPRVTGSGGGEA
jgi:hypothetical protein